MGLRYQMLGKGPGFLDEVFPLASMNRVGAASESPKTRGDLVSQRLDNIVRAQSHP